MPRPVPHITQMCSIRNPYTLKGTYIGSVMTIRGVELLVVEKRDGQCFVGVKGSLAILQATTLAGTPE